MSELDVKMLAAAKNSLVSIAAAMVQLQKLYEHAPESKEAFLKITKEVVVKAQKALKTFEKVEL